MCRSHQVGSQTRSSVSSWLSGGFSATARGGVGFGDGVGGWGGGAEGGGGGEPDDPGHRAPRDPAGHRETFPLAAGLVLMAAFAQRLQILGDGPSPRTRIAVVEGHPMIEFTRAGRACTSGEHARRVGRAHQRRQPRRGPIRQRPRRRLGEPAVPVVVAAQPVQGGVAGEAVDQLPDAEFGQPRQHRRPIGERRDRAGAAVFAADAEVGDGGQCPGAGLGFGVRAAHRDHPEVARPQDRRPVERVVARAGVGQDRDRVRAGRVVEPRRDRPGFRWRVRPRPVIDLPGFRILEHVLFEPLEIQPFVLEFLGRGRHPWFGAVLVGPPRRHHRGVLVVLHRDLAELLRELLAPAVHHRHRPTAPTRPRPGHRRVDGIVHTRRGRRRRVLACGRGIGLARCGVHLDGGGRDVGAIRCGVGWRREVGR